MLRRSAGGWQRPRMVNILASFCPPTCDKPFVTLDVMFPIRVGAECGAVQERLSAPEGGESVQTAGAETGETRIPVLLGHLSWLRYIGYISPHVYIMM